MFLRKANYTNFAALCQEANYAQGVDRNLKFIIEMSEEINKFI